MRNGMAAYERNCVGTKVAQILNRPQKKNFKGLSAGVKKEESYNLLQGQHLAPV